MLQCVGSGVGAVFGWSGREVCWHEGLRCSRDAVGEGGVVRMYVWYVCIHLSCVAVSNFGVIGAPLGYAVGLALKRELVGLVGHRVA